MQIVSLKSLLGHGPKRVSIDTETTGLNAFRGDRPFLCGVCDETFRCATVWMSDLENVELLKRVTVDTSIAKVFQHAKFDWHMLQHAGFTLDGLIEDTMALGRLVYMGEEAHPSMALEALVQRYLPNEGPKLVEPVNRWLREHDAEWRRYTGGPPKYSDLPRHLAAARVITDAYLTMKLYQLLIKKLDGPLRGIYETELRVLRALQEAEAKGILFDTKGAEEIRPSVAAQKVEIEKQIYSVLGGTFNIGSPKQLIKRIYDALGIRLVSTSELMIESLPEPACGLILRWRICEKLLTSYLDGWRDLVTDSILHTTISQMGTNTGRMACSKPNLMAIPRTTGHTVVKEGAFRREAHAHVRRLLRVRPGHLGTALDYRHMELRMYAVLAGDDVLMETFHRGEDPHGKIAETMYGKITPNLRQEGKTIVFGLLYGMGIPTLASRLHTDLVSAEQKREIFFRAFPKCKAWMQKLRNESNSGLPSRNLVGRMYRLGRERGHKLPVFICQGSAADFLKRGIAAIHPLLQQAGGYLQVPIHDELILEIPGKFDADLFRQLKHVMEEAAQPCIPLELKTTLLTPNWATGVLVKL